MSNPALANSGRSRSGVVAVPPKEGELPARGKGGRRTNSA